MTEALVLGLLLSVLSGVAGDTVSATVVLHAPQASTIEVAGTPYQLQAGDTKAVQVPLTLKRGKQKEIIEVKTDTVTYELPVTLIGTPNYQVPLIVGAAGLLLTFVASVRLRTTAARS